MFRSTPNAELSNIGHRLHNLEEDELDIYRANYLFMKQSPMVVLLESKYKKVKKENRELRRMIDLLNRQHFEWMEKYVSHSREPREVGTQWTAEVSVKKEPTVEVADDSSEIEEIQLEKKEVVYEIHEIADDSPPVAVVEEVVAEFVESVLEKVVEEEVDPVEIVEKVVEEEVEEEVDEVEVEVEEEEEVEVEEEEVEVEEEEVEVEEEEEVEVEEEEEVEVEEDEEVEEEEVDEVEVEVEVEEEEVEVEEEEVEVEEEEVEVEEEEVEVEEEEVEVEEIEEEEEDVEEEEVEVEEDVEEEEVEVEEEEVEVEAEGEEEGVYEVVIQNKKYYTTDETNGTIYTIEDNEEIGEEIGQFVNGKAIFHTVA